MKPCKTCGVEKDFDAYYAHKGNRDGLSIHCKDCMCAKERAKRPLLYVPTREERFWSHVDKTESASECWLWTGCVGAWGYGSFQRWLAHRFSYMLAHDVELTPEQCVCHSCDTPRCVNPAHLWVGTSKQNTDDCIAKGRFTIGEKRKSAKLTNEKVSEIKALRASGVGRKLVAAAFGVHPATVQLIDKGRNWKHVK